MVPTPLRRTLGATPLTVKLGALLGLLYGSTIAVMAVIPFFFSKRMNWNSFEVLMGCR